MVVLLALLDPIDSLAQVTTTTTYEYDPVSLQVKKETVESTDVEDAGEAYREVEYEYAFEFQQTAMEGLNMLSQLGKTVVRGPNGETISCTQTDWYPHTTGTGTTYLPMYWGRGCGSEFTWIVSAGDPGDYDALGRLVRIRSGGLTTQYYYGDPSPTSPSGSFTNATSNPYLTGSRRSGYGVAGADWNEPGKYLTQRFVYDAQGRLAALYDENERKASFHYDGLGRLLEVKNDVDETVTKHEYEYSDDGTGAYTPSRPNRVTTIQYGSVDQAATVWFDGLGRPIGTSSYETTYYDIASITEYDVAGRPYKSWRPARFHRGYYGVPTAATWDGGGYQTPSAFSSTSQSYWDSRWGVSSSDAQYAYAETTYEESPLGRPTFVRDPGEDGNGVTYRYGVGQPDEAAPASGCSGSGAYIRCARPEGPSSEMAYVETEDADGRRTRTYTDGLGRERFVRAGLGSAQETLTEMAYDAADQLVEVRHPNYFRPRADEVTSRAEHRTTYTYDTRGNLTATDTPDAGLVKLAYDPAGRLIRRQDADQRAGGGTYGQVTLYSNDAMGRIYAVHRGTLACAFETVVYNTCDGGVTWGSAVTEPGEGELFRRLVFDDPLDNQYGNPNLPYGGPWYVEGSFSFDNTLGRLAAEAYLSEGKWSSVAYAYDSEGQVARRSVNTDGVTNPYASFDYAYDRAGLLEDRIVEVGSQAFRQTFTYKPTGQMHLSYSGTGVAGTTVPVSLESNHYYDAEGAPYYTYFYGMTSTGTGSNLEYRYYDIEGRLTNVQDPSFAASPFREKIEYTPGGLVDLITYQGASSGTYAATGSPYDANAKLREWEYRFTYGSLGQLASARYGGQGYDLGSYNVEGVTYDSNGNLLSLTRQAPTGTSGSGPIDQLTYTYTPGTNQLYGVADAANTAQWSEVEWDADPSTSLYTPGGLLSRYTYDSGAPYGEPYRQVLRYDERGTPTYETLSLWDDDYIGYLGSAITTRYDAAGQRIWRQFRDASWNTTTGRYVIDGGEVVGEFDGNGALRYWNTTTGRIDGDGTRYVYRRDHLGSIRAVQRKSDGVLVEARDYYAFGLQMPGRVYVQGSETREGYTGHELDQETGMYYAGARYYMPALGRWTSIDPLASQYPGLSPYNYVANNPIMLVDPDGREIKICHTSSSSDAEGNESQNQECLTYESGMEYEGDNDYLAKAVGALSGLYGSESASSVLDALIGSEEIYTLTNGDVGKGGALAGYNTKSRVLTMGDFSRPSLSHELFHAYQQDQGFIRTGDRRIDAEVGSYLFSEVVERDLGEKPYYYRGGLTWVLSHSSLLDKGFDRGQYGLAVRSFYNQSTHNKPNLFGQRGYGGFTLPAMLSTNPPIRRFLR